MADVGVLAHIFLSKLHKKDDVHHDEPEDVVVEVCNRGAGLVRWRHGDWPGLAGAGIGRRRGGMAGVGRHREAAMSSVLQTTVVRAATQRGAHRGRQTRKNCFGPG